MSQSPNLIELNDGEMDIVQQRDECVEESVVRKRSVVSVPVENKSLSNEKAGKKVLEVLYDGHCYDVTEFIKEHPGGNIIELYTESGEDATIAMQHFHSRSLETVMARMKGLKRRPASNNEIDLIDLDPETKKRHDELSKDFLKLSAELEADGLMNPNPRRFATRILQSLGMFICGLAIHCLLGQTSLMFRALSVTLMAIAGGQYLWLGHTNSFTGNPRIDRAMQIFSFGFVFGLSSSSWNSTHSKHHVMPQQENKDADLNTRMVRDPKQTNKIWIYYQHLLFVFCDTFIVTLTWKFNHHIKYAIENKCWFDLICMICHYSLIPVVGFVDWMIITWITSNYSLVSLILSHAHLPVVEKGKKLHWVEYAFHTTKNIRSSWFVDWFTGHLNCQIEHHLFPTMPEYKGKLCRDKTRAFAQRHNLPYHLCTYWEAVKSAYYNLEKVSN